MHLRGVDYPASKDDLVAHTEKGPRPDTADVVDALKKLPDKSYKFPVDVMEEYGKVA